MELPLLLQKGKEFFLLFYQQINYLSIFCFLSDLECFESCSVIMNFASALDQEVFSNEEDGSVTFYN